MTAGTTNEKTMRDLAAKFKLGMTAAGRCRPCASRSRCSPSGQADAFATDDVLLYGLIAQSRRRRERVPRGRRLPLLRPVRHHVPQGRSAARRRWSTTPSSELAADGEIERQYKRWFLRKLPSGASLDLPMSPQLETIIQTMAGGEAQ